jgi:hypothetical protein
MKRPPAALRTKRGRCILDRSRDNEAFLNVALGHFKMAPLDGADRNWAAFGVPRPVEFRTAAQHAHLVVVLVNTDPAIQILFERQVLDKRVSMGGGS